MVSSVGILKLSISSGVAGENWLPINRQDEALDIVMRIYAPDLEKMKTWTPPKAEMIK